MTEQPDFGPQPTLEWIAVNKMIVDPAYQRDATGQRSKKLIATIAREFRWARCQPLMVTPRDGGKFAILDGQHRRAGAMKAGIGALPCMVVPAGSIEAEADAFIRLNDSRIRIDPYRMHHSRVVAGDPDAVLIKSVCDRAGVVIPRYPKDRANIAPNETLALEAIRRGIRLYEPPTVILALSAMAQAYAEARAQLRAALLRGVCLFIWNLPTSADKERLVRALENIEAEEIEIAARGVRRDTGESVDAIIANAVGRHYDAVYFPRREATDGVTQEAACGGGAATHATVDARLKPAPAKPATSIMRAPVAPANGGGHSVSVAPATANAIVTCGCKRQFRPAFPGQVKCNVCSDKFASAQPAEAAE